MGKESSLLGQIQLKPRALRKADSTYSIVPSSEVTEGSLQVWRGLPVSMRDDPSLASFREQHLMRHGPIDKDNESNRISDLNVADNSSTTKLTGANKNYVLNIASDLDQRTSLDKTTVHGDRKSVEPDKSGSPQNQHSAWYTNTKLSLMILVWLVFTGILMSTTEKVLTYRHLSVAVNEMRYFVAPTMPINARLAINLRGPFAKDRLDNDNYLNVYVEMMLGETTTNSTDGRYTENISEVHRVQLVSDDQLHTVAEWKNQHTFYIDRAAFEKVHSPNSQLRIRFSTSNTNETVPFRFAYDDSPLDKSVGVICAAILLFCLYVMIICEVVHRTISAIFASTMAIALLAVMHERPTMPEIVSWIDVETLLLLFGMMILVSILSETGIFDYLAVFAYKVTGGRVWALINCLCLFTAMTSSFLDNVTTVMLMTPVTIRLSEMMGLNPRPILMAMMIHSNIGGAMTPVGDPPNAIVASNAYIKRSGVTFFSFSVHMSAGIVFVLIQTYFQLRYQQFRDINTLRFREPPNIQELRHEISVWQRAAASLSSYSKDEDLVRVSLLKKVNRLNKQLKKRIASGSVPVESYQATLNEMTAKYPIRNPVLLIKSAVVIVFAISFFFLHSMPHVQRLSLGWTALLAAVLLLVLADRDDLEAVLSRVEWSTLLFFAALFVLMETMTLLGLIGFIGRQTEALIMSVGEGPGRLAVAVLIILWVSAIAAAFVDNIPLTTMMVKIAISLAENKALNLPLQPLVWALAFGGCLGGNGTLIGASANVVCSGVAEQHGYRISFFEYFKVGFPIMLGNVLVATVYLMICHVVFQWH